MKHTLDWIVPNTRWVVPDESSGIYVQTAVVRSGTNHADVRWSGSVVHGALPAFFCIRRDLSLLHCRCAGKMEDGEDLRKGSSTLFAVFLFSILSLFLIPYTAYRLCSGGEDASEDVKPWEGVRIS